MGLLSINLTMLQLPLESTKQLPPKTVDKHVSYLWVSALKPTIAGLTKPARFLSPLAKVDGYLVKTDQERDKVPDQVTKL